MTTRLGGSANNVSRWLFERLDNANVRQQADPPVEISNQKREERKRKLRDR
jgi:hypothetical protein